MLGSVFSQIFKDPCFQHEILIDSLNTINKINSLTYLNSEINIIKLTDIFTVTYSFNCLFLLINCHSLLCDLFITPSRNKIGTFLLLIKVCFYKLNLATCHSSCNYSNTCSHLSSTNYSDFLDLLRKHKTILNLTAKNLLEN